MLMSTVTLLVLSSCTHTVVDNEITNYELADKIKNIRFYALILASSHAGGFGEILNTVNGSIVSSSEKHMGAHPT